MRSIEKDMEAVKENDIHYKYHKDSKSRLKADLVLEKRWAEFIFQTRRLVKNLQPGLQQT